MLLQQHGADAWVMAGGLDSFDWLKDRIKRPKVVVDLSGIEELKGIRTTGDGIEIGAMTTLTEIVKHPVIREKYGLAGRSAPNWPLRRRFATRARSAAMYRRTRAAGITAAAGRVIAPAATSATPTRPPAATASTPFFDAERCVAVNPSDSAPALIALDAKFVMRTPKGERVVDAEDYFIGPDIDITRLNILTARRSADRHSHSVHMGGRAILF